ncbi:MAG: flagellar motor switch protein FliG [Endozoicomonas sp.]|uniref:flagellar motor switch protein FliG n=1 Tax=Endozoicomonas sp. TaxID=1892382 RepID=UPI003D9BFE14
MSEELSSSPHEVAVLLLSLGEKGAAQVFKHLSSREVRQISQTMANMPPMKRDEVQNVMNHFFHEYRYEVGIAGGTRNYLEKSLKIAMGDKDAKNLMDSIYGEENTSSLEMMKWMEPSAVAELIVNEHPQLQAVVLTYLEPGQAALVLQRLPERCHEDLLTRIAKLKELHPSIVQELNVIFDDSVGLISTSQNTSVSGLRQVADIMNRMNESSVSHMLEHFKEQDSDLADRIEQQMFVFEHFSRLDEDTIRKIIEEIPQNTLSLALKGASEPISSKFINTMTRREAKYLQDDMDSLGTVRSSQVQQARQEILNTARTLSQNGQIELNLSDEDEMIE